MILEIFGTSDDESVANDWFKVALALQNPELLV